MCFSVALTRESIKRDSRFSHLLDEMDQTAGSRISGFSFPGLPLLTDGVNAKARLAHWGLIPSWVKEDRQAKRIRSGTLNARWETVALKPSFRDSWPFKRCLLAVDGFYEPHVEGGIKSTWFVRRKDRGLLYLGGIYEENGPEALGFPTFTFSILTLEARDLLAEVHNEKMRMPLVLGEEKAPDWLDQQGTIPDADDPSWCLDQSILTASEFRKGASSSLWTQGELF
jgi:putative SOS response-associated peptidase YedK